MSHGSIRLLGGFIEPAQEFGNKILKHGGIERVDLVLAAALNPNQVRQFERGEVMRKRCGPERGNPGQVSGSPLAAA